MFVMQAVPVVSNAALKDGLVMGELFGKCLMGTVSDEVHPQIIGNQMCETIEHEVG